MDKTALHKAMKQELTDADDKLAKLTMQQKDIEYSIEYWTRHVDAARTVVARLSIELHNDTSND